MEAVVRTQNLTKKYGDLVAVDQLNLTLHRGEIFGLLGPNGAGKTTTILMLIGLTEPTLGQARVFGHDPLREPLRVKRVVGYLAENLGFYEDLTARENVLFTAALNGIERSHAEKRVRDLLELVGLGEACDKEVSKYSRGMKQRLGVADVLVKAPQLLLLDEPTAGVDPEGARGILEIITNLSKEGKTILLSSHLLYQVQKICDRVGIFVNGRMVAEGPVERLGKEVIGADKFTIEAEVPGASPQLVDRICSISGVLGVDRVGDSITIRCESDIKGEISRLVVNSGHTLTGIKSHEYALDEIYARYFKGESQT